MNVSSFISRNALASGLFMAAYEPDAPARPSSHFGLAGASGWYAADCHPHVGSMNNPG